MSNNHEEIVASSEWRRDYTRLRCASCNKEFHELLNRRHHCRLCGDVFCDKCTQQRALIPPSAIVLQPKGGKKVHEELPTPFQNDADPNRRLTFKRVGNRNLENSLQASPIIGDVPEESGTGSNLATSSKALTECDDDYVLHQSVLEDDLLSLSVASSTGISYATESIATSYSQNRGGSLIPRDGTDQEEVILYGKGLEQRMKMAREPLRVCRPCHDKLEELQEELRNCNSNAMRYNSIDPTHIRRLLNSPVAFTLGHEVRKAAYTLNNLLPLPKRMGSFMPVNNYETIPNIEQCNNLCIGGPSDGVRIPARLMEMAKGVAVMTIFKAGIGFAGFEFGTGLVVSRLGSHQWSPPCAIGSASASIGALAGAQISDHIFLLMTDEAVDIMSTNEGSFQLGVDIGVAVGPLGRSAEADMGIGSKVRDETSTKGPLTMVPIYTYSQSKGFYAGVSLDGKVVVTRHEVNQKFYGQQVTSRDLLSGKMPTPLAAQPLYDALKRCHVYAAASTGYKKL